MSSTTAITTQGVDSSGSGDLPTDVSGTEKGLVAEEILVSSQSSPWDVHGLKWVLVVVVV
ncbi:hypothetical protein PENNAL_c0036G00438 [Penicillium nalgiovense]|uniref:Uncharacterized protein n=1 Tax=Penicillium nalgiovense TaxID=60175 RepID=A0A1V6Y4Y5_PENNA|nr:hypothetical protein PENNAL_c0036G00438 [Penicillium nalgiovense]